MNRTTGIFLLIALVISLAFRCSPTQSAGGTGTETVNTFARLPDGTPAEGARAKIVAARWWIDSISSGSSAVLGEAITNECGFVSIRLEKQNAPVNLQIDHDNGALLLPLEADFGNLSDTVTLKAATTLSGTMTDSTGLPSRVLLSGSSYATTVGASGAFSFEGIAPGSYGIVSASDIASTPRLFSSGALSLEEGTSTTGYTLAAPANRLLVDNFESGVGPTALGRIFPILGWYVLSDSLYYLWNPENSRWEQGISMVIGNSPIYYDSVTIDGNTAFSVSTVLDEVSFMANAIFGFSAKPLSEEGIDLSSMTAVSVRASGKGTMRLRFESRGLDSINARLSHYTYPLVLTDTMKSFVFSTDSLSIIEPIANASDYPWENESRNILRVEFEFSTVDNPRGDSLYCTIDDFYFEGVSLNSIATR